MMHFLSLSVLATAALITVSPAAAQHLAAPDTVQIRSGSLTLRGLLWRPPGKGPFPAVLFNHGSYQTGASSIMLEPATIGPVLARHGYIVFVLFREGVGLSAGQGISGGDRMEQARLRGGQPARERMQLELLEGAELAQAQAGMRYLRQRSDVDQRRVAVIGHSFGGSLSLLMAARDTAILAVVSFGGAAASWNDAPLLRARLVAAVRQTRAGIFFNHAANDYSTAPGRALAAEMRRLRRPHLLRIYPAFGKSSRDGHNIVFRDPSIWESDVVAFLSEYLNQRRGVADTKSHAH